MSKEYSLLLDSLLNGEALGEQQAYDLMMKLAEGELPPALGQPCASWPFIRRFPTVRRRWIR